jgi:hypothetical protein
VLLDRGPTLPDAINGSQNGGLGGNDAKIWKSRGQIGSQRDATAQARNAPLRESRKRRSGKEPETGHCDRLSEARKKGAKVPRKSGT